VYTIFFSRLGICFLPFLYGLDFGTSRVGKRGKIN